VGRGWPGDGLLADRRLRYVLAALAASEAADGFGPLALSFAVLRVTGSAGRLGLVLAAQATAALVPTLAGGLAADRFDRGRILIGSLAVRAGAAALLAATLATRTASFPLLLAAAGVYGCADGFFGPASTAVRPDIVPRTGWRRPTPCSAGPALRPQSPPRPWPASSWRSSGRARASRSRPRCWSPQPEP
jgi:MFS family permease